MRFRQLETIRAYAMERLKESGETEQTRRRAVEWLSELFAPLLDAVYTHATADRALAEQENARRPGCFTGPSQHARGAPMLVLALALVRHHQDQLTAAQALLQQGPEWPDSRLQVARLALASRVSTWQGDPETALRFGEQAVALARCLDHPALLARALDARACARLIRREFSQAVEDLRGCADVAAVLGCPADEAVARHNLSWALLRAHRPAEADSLLTRSLPVLREHAPPELLAAALHTAGAVRLALDDLPTAEELFAESLRAPRRGLRGVLCGRGAGRARGRVG